MQPMSKAEMAGADVTIMGTLPRSTSFVAMTMIRQFSCQTIRQKSTTVCCRQPCVAMYDLDCGSDRPWSIYKNDGNSDYCHICLTAIFPREPGSAGSPWGPSPPPVPEVNLWMLVEWGFFIGRIYFSQPKDQCQSINRNQWPGLIFSSTTRLLMEGTLIPLYQLFHASSEKYEGCS